MYERVDFVRTKGEFSIRGDIIDIFSPNNNDPARILFDFEKVESLNLFSTEDQLSFNAIDSYKIPLSSEMQFNNENISCFRRLFRKLKITNKNGKENKNFPPIVKIAAIIKDKYTTIFFIKRAIFFELVRVNQFKNK